MSIDINGVAHIYITVQDFARCRPFYGALLPFFGMVCLVDTDELYYCIGGRTGIGIRAASTEHAARRSISTAPECITCVCARAARRTSMRWRVSSPISARASCTPPQLDEWAPGYYSVLFEDPCGTRLEVNHVPGKGHLADDAQPAARCRRAAAPQRSSSGQCLAPAMTYGTRRGSDPSVLPPSQ